MTPKLRNPKINKVETLTTSFKEAAKKYGLSVDEDIIPTKEASVYILDMTAEMVNAISHVLYKHIPTRRIHNINVKCTDPSVLVECVKNFVSRINLSKKTPLGKVSLDISHTDPEPNPIPIKSHYFKYESGKDISSNCENITFMVIGQGESCQITGEIVEYPSIDMHTNFNAINLFSREGIEEYDENDVKFEDTPSMEIEYHKGYFMFRYQDFDDGKDMMRAALDTLAAKYQEVLDNFVSWKSRTIAKIIIELPNDPQTIFANLLQIYLYVGLGRDTRVDINRQFTTLLEIHATDSTRDPIIEKIIIDTLNLLIKDIKGLTV